MYPEARIIKPMKIWKLPDGKESMLSDICQNGEYFLEEKIDGYWYQFEKTEHYKYLFSRSVSRVTGYLSEKSANVPIIMEALDCLPPRTILIGEIYVPGGTSKTVTTIMGCLPAEAIKRQSKQPVHYYVHDIIEYDGVDLMNTGAEDRYNILAAIWKKHGLDKYGFLRLATKVDTELEAEISRILNSGGEGVVLKKRDYPYVPDKRPAWSSIKVKQMDSIDLVCMGFCPPTKEYTGKELDNWSFWILEDEDGSEIGRSNASGYDFYKGEWKPVTKYFYYGWNTAIRLGAYDEEGNLVEVGTVSSGLTDSLKEDMTRSPEKYLGRVCTLDCMSINHKDHTVRHPAFKCWRDDKDAKDCLISEEF